MRLSKRLARMHARFVSRGTRVAVPFLKAPLTRAGKGGAEGGLSAKPFFSAFSLLCEIQGRPCSALEQTLSVERKQGKGVVTGFPGGVPPPSLPRFAGKGPPPSLSRGAEKRPLQAFPLTGKLLHDKSCVPPLATLCQPQHESMPQHKMLWKRAAHFGDHQSRQVSLLHQLVDARRKDRTEQARGRGIQPR